MAMSIVWIAMLTLSVSFGILNDSASAVGSAALIGARSGVEATLAIAGALCLWSGLGRVLEHSGLSEKLTHLLAPLLRRLFPRAFRDPAAAAALSANFAANLLGVLEETGGRLYLLGGKPGIAEQAAENMKKTHPKLCICGTADGYFKDEAPVIARINEARADVVFVCLGAPKQECFMHDHRAELNVRLMIGLGGSLDGFAGTVRRAPKWMIRLQLEWLYRLLREPSRIGRMMRLPKFVFAAWRARGKKE